VHQAGWAEVVMNGEEGFSGRPSTLDRMDSGIGRLFKNVRDAVVILDVDSGRIHVWNPAAEALFGYSADEASRLTVEDLVPERLRARHRVAVARYRATGHGSIVDGLRPLEAPALTKSGVERMVELTLSPVDLAPRPGRYLMAIVRDVGARVQATARRVAHAAAEAEQQRLAFLSEAGSVLSSSLDYQSTLTQVTRLVVPFLADGCSVDLLDEEGRIRRLAVACVDPEREAIAREIALRYPPNPDASSGIAAVLRSGRPKLYSDPSELDAMWQKAAHDSHHLAMLRRLRTTSRMVVPLIARGQTMGVIALGLTDPARRYGPADLALAEELARRAAIAIDNARLYQSLARSEQRFRSFVQNASDVVVVFGADQTVRYASPPLRRVLGYDPDAIIGARAGTLVHPEDKDLVEETARAVIQEPGSQRTIELRLRHADGSWRTIEAHATNQIAEPAVRGMVVNLHDITERKRTEEDARFLAEAGAVLVTSLEYGTTLIQMLGLAVPRLGDWCTIDMLETNGSLRRLAVAASDPEFERVLIDLARHYPIEPSSRHPIAQAIRLGEAILTPNVPDELPQVARGAAHLDLMRALHTRSQISVPLVAHGRTLGVICFGYAGSGRQHDERDLSLARRFGERAALAMENARLYDDAQAALAEATRALDLRDEFLSVASHELRTPLTALKGQVQLAERWLRRGEQATVITLIQHADAQVDRLTRLVRALLDVSRVEAGGIPVDPEPTAIDAVVRRVVEMERAAAPDREIELDLPNGTPLVIADEERIEQVLINVLQNARKYSPPTAPISVRVTVDGEMVSVAVQDHGMGIPAEDLSRIFERFHRGANVDRNIVGLGIGLYVAREIVTALGGGITVDSESGKGSTFTISLPCATLDDLDPMDGEA
jgi:PAS domain S-box-containing protein